MRIHYGYSLVSTHFKSDLLRLADFFEQNGVESITGLEIDCLPWRNGHHLQAIDGARLIRPVVFDLEPNDSRYTKPSLPHVREALTILERTDNSRGLSDRGLMALLGSRN